MAGMLKRIFYCGMFAVFISGCVTITEQSAGHKANSIEVAESRISLGLAYLNAQQWERARQNLELAVQFAPKYYRSRIALAYYLQEVGEDDQAEAQFKTALKFSPRNGDVQNNYGVFLCRQERYKEAQRAFSKAIAQPYYYKLSASYENAALCALKAKDLSNAKVWFEKALDHEPNRPNSLMQLANMEVATGKFNDARVRLFLFHKRFGYRPETLLTMIKLEDKAGRPEESEKFAGLLARQFPESKENLQYLKNEY